MSLMSSLTDYLEADTAWTDLVGDRVHPISAPQDEVAPFVAYRLKEEGRDYAMDGPAELMMPEIEFTIESATYLEAHEIATALSNRLDGYRGVMGDIVVTHIRFFDSRDGESKDEVLSLYSVICDVSVWYKRA